GRAEPCATVRRTRLSHALTDQRAAALLVARTPEAGGCPARAVHMARRKRAPFPNREAVPGGSGALSSFRLRWGRRARWPRSIEPGSSLDRPRLRCRIAW